MRIFHIYFVIIWTIKEVAARPITATWTKNDFNSEVIDMTPHCGQGEIKVILLPYGVGLADATVITLSHTPVLKNCNITFKVHRSAKQTEGIIIVVEYVDMFTDEHFDMCTEANYINMSLIDPNKYDASVCKKISNQRGRPVLVYVAKAGGVSVMLDADYFFSTVKITATSTKSKGESCNEKETLCFIQMYRVCVNSHLECDYNINCGEYDGNDEDYKLCRVSSHKHLWIIVMTAFVLAIALFAVLVYMLKVSIPSVTDDFFIFNEDEDNRLILTSVLKKTEMNSIVEETKDDRVPTKYFLMERDPKD